MSAMEEPREQWQHRRGDQYAPIFGDWFGNERDGFHHAWSRLGSHGLLATLGRAISQGMRAQGSDDFNVAVVRDGAVVALLWMREDMAEEPDVLANVAEVLGL